MCNTEYVQLLYPLEQPNHWKLYTNFLHKKKAIMRYPICKESDIIDYDLHNITTLNFIYM